MKTRKILIQNMGSEADAKKVKSVLHDVWGIRKVAVNLDHKEAVFSYDEQAASEIDFEQAVADCGFKIENAESTVKQEF